MAVPSHGHGRAGNQVRAPERCNPIVSYRESGRKILGWRSPSRLRAAFLGVTAMNFSFLRRNENEKENGCLYFMLRPSWCGMSFAEEEKTSPEVDPVATQMTEAYPSPDAILPPVPVPPEKGIQDVAAFQKYAEEVDLYVKACQHYIDGATNDANAIIEARNKAVKKAQEAVDVYNRFFDK